MALLADVGAAELPLARDALHSLLAALDDVAVVLDGQPPVLADVTQVRPDRRHSPPSSGDLDHDLGRPAHGGLDPAADRRGAVAEGTETRRPALDDPVPGIEEALAPLDEHAVDGWIRTHRCLP
jgi:hypothetical protein